MPSGDMSIRRMTLDQLRFGDDNTKGKVTITQIKKTLITQIKKTLLERVTEAFLWAFGW